MPEPQIHLIVDRKPVTIRADKYSTDVAGTLHVYYRGSETDTYAGGRWQEVHESVGLIDFESNEAIAWAKRVLADNNN